MASIAQKKSVDGEWWFEKDSSQTVVGTLRLNAPGAARLEFSGPSKHIDLEFRDYDTIWGRGYDGTFYSLAACFDTSSRTGVTGLTTKEVFVSKVFEGFLMPASEATLQGISAKAPLLPFLHERSSIKVSHEKIGIDIAYSYSPPSAIRFTTDELGEVSLRFGLDRYSTNVTPGHHVEFRESGFVTITPAFPQPFEQLSASMCIIEDFFRLIMARNFYVEEHKVWGLPEWNPRHPEGRESTAQVFAERIVKADANPDKKPEKMLLPDLAEDEMAKLLKNWVSVASKFRPARVLYVSALYTDHTYLDTRFSMFVQAAEAIHRRLHQGKYLGEAEFSDQVLKPLREAIPSILPRDVRDAFNGKLNYLNEYSLAKRLRELASPHASFLGEIIPNWKAMIRNTVNLRNYLAHYPEESTMQPEGRMFLRCNALLRLLIELSFLSVIDADMEKAYSAARKLPAYRELGIEG